VFGEGAQAFETQNRYVVLGTGTFNGVSAIETQVDTTFLGSVFTQNTANTSGRSFFYDNIVGPDFVNYGGKSTSTTTAGGVTQTSTSTFTNTPAVRYPLASKVGDVISQTYTVKTSNQFTITGAPTGTTVPTPTTPDRTETQTWKFLAVESVTVLAGTFQTCRIESTTTSTQAGGTTTTDTLTAWLVASGPLRGLTAKLSTASTGQILEAKVLRVN
jgi:hypothetical protein